MKHKGKILVTLAVVLVGGGLGYRYYKNKNKGPSYDTVKVESQNLVQTVDGTGKIESLNAVTLRFELPGKIQEKNVVEGASVKEGQVLASLRLADLNAAVAQAQANLNQKLAGATDEEKRYYKAAVDAAKASLDQSRTDSLNASVDMVNVLQASLPKFDDAMTQSDNILAVDNSFANYDFKTFLSVSSPNSLTTGYSDYAYAKNAVQRAKNYILPLSTVSDEDSIQSALANSESAFAAVTKLLTDVSDVLKYSVTGGSFTQAVLDGKKSTIEATRSSFAVQYSAFINQKQLMNSAENNINLKLAAYNQAVANYEGKSSAPREVDVAALRAVLAQAIANREKAIIKAPIDGVVTKVYKDPGETVSTVDPIIDLLSPHYQVKVDISETDVSKLSVGDEATITLDAFGEDTKFKGKVISIDPGSTEIQDVVYYKVTVSLEDSDKVKPGMTANVAVKTNEKNNVLIIPFRSIRTRSDGTKYVKVLENGNSTEKNVTLGLRGDEGKVEITSGLKEGDLVILSTN
jgi:HlyD family secretion protein